MRHVTAGPEGPGCWGVEREWKGSPEGMPTGKVRNVCGNDWKSHKHICPNPKEFIPNSSSP